MMMMMDGKAGGRNSSIRSNKSSSSSSSTSTTHSTDQEEMMAEDLRRGPWTVEEDMKLINYIASHGEGRWNSLARCAGLKRTGKSCRLRWLNYLRPDVRRGNITLEEQLMILELHSRWGNRWSKIAQHLPGRTDNEIKNYWRTRVQKHAKQLKCDVNSKQFKDTMRYLWMPRLMERIQAANNTGAAVPTSVTATTNNPHHHLLVNNQEVGTEQQQHLVVMPPAASAAAGAGGLINSNVDFGVGVAGGPSNYTPENSASSDSFGTQVSPVSDLTTDCYNIPVSHNLNQDYNFQAGGGQVSYSYSDQSIISPSGYFSQGLDFPSMDPQNNSQWPMDGGDTSDNLWNLEDFWCLQQLNNNLSSM